MTKASLTLTGFEEYIDELQRAAQDIDQVAGEALEAGANILVERMQSRAPYTRIKNMVRKTSLATDGDKKYIYVGVLRGAPKRDMIIAMAWEYGSVNNPPKPYIRPTLRNDSKRARDAMAEKFEEWLK